MTGFGVTQVTERGIPPGYHTPGAELRVYQPGMCGRHCGLRAVQIVHSTWGSKIRLGKRRTAMMAVQDAGPR